MHVIDVIILVGWAVFWVFWFAAAIGVKAGKNRWGQFAGIRVKRIKTILYMVSGLVCSLAGVLLTFRLDTSVQLVIPHSALLAMKKRI